MADREGDRPPGGATIHFLRNPDGVRSDGPVRSDDEVGGMTPLTAALLSRICPEMGGAAGYAGVPDKHFHAFMLYVTGEKSYIKTLRLPLLESAIKLRQRNKWPRTHAGRPWTESLSQMALCEYADPGISRLNGWWERVEKDGELRHYAWDAGGCQFVEGWWAKWISATSGEWAKVLSPRYESLRAILDGWRSSAWRSMYEVLKGANIEDFWEPKAPMSTSGIWGDWEWNPALDMTHIFGEPPEDGSCYGRMPYEAEPLSDDSADRYQRFDWQMEQYLDGEERSRTKKAARIAMSNYYDDDGKE